MLLKRLPAGVGKVAQITRWLDLDRSIVQRVVLGVRDGEDGLRVLERFPGVRGLEQFLEALEKRGCPKDLLQEARRALDNYAALVSQAGGSQARLVGQIGKLRSIRTNASKTPSGIELERARKVTYEGAVGLTGLASEARVEVVIIGPDASGFEGKVTTVSATGFIGLEAAAYAIPLVRRSRLAGMRPVAMDTKPANGGGLRPDVLVPGFTSEPMPRVTTRTEGEFVLQTIDTEAAMVEPVDIVAALAFSWNWGEPKEPDNDFYSVGRVIGTPARRLVFDFYLHRSLPPARAIGAHVLRPGTLGSLGNARPASRWFDAMPHDHDLTLLGGAPGDRTSTAYARLGDLTRHLVQASGWENESFTGYRLELAYPVFDFEYIIAMEY